MIDEKLKQILKRTRKYEKQKILTIEDLIEIFKEKVKILEEECKYIKNKHLLYKLKKEKIKNINLLNNIINALSNF